MDAKRSRRDRGESKAKAAAPAKEKKITYVPAIKSKIKHVFEGKKGKSRPSSASSSLSSGARRKVKELKERLEPSPAEEEEDEDDLEDDEAEAEDLSESDPDEDGDHEDGEDGDPDEEEEEGHDEEDEEREEDAEAEQSSEEEGDEASEEEDDKGEPVTLDKINKEGESKTGSAVAKPVRNSVTNKKDWDSFVRSKERFKVHQFFQQNKLECFNMWLDMGKSWDAVALKVKRTHEESHESQRGWVAKQGRVLKEEKGVEKATKIMASRKAAGLFYRDEDFPDDEDDPSASHSKLSHVQRFSVSLLS